MFAIELKYGLDLDGDRHRDRRLHGPDDVEVLLLDLLRPSGTSRSGCSRRSARSRSRRHPACPSRSRPSPRSRHAVQAGDDRDVDRRARLANELEILRGPDVVVVDLREIRERLAERSPCPSRRKCSTASRSWRICSSKSENRTTARGPVVLEPRIVSTFSERGDADATNGFLSVEAHVAGGQIHVVAVLRSRCADVPHCRVALVSRPCARSAA